MSNCSIEATEQTSAPFFISSFTTYTGVTHWGWNSTANATKIGTLKYHIPRHSREIWRGAKALRPCKCAQWLIPGIASLIAKNINGTFVRFRDVFAVVITKQRCMWAPGPLLRIPIRHQKYRHGRTCTTTRMLHFMQKIESLRPLTHTIALQLWCYQICSAVRPYFSLYRTSAPRCRR